MKYMPKETQEILFSQPTDWSAEWNGMPEYGVEALRPFRTIKINFRSESDVESFSKLIGQNISPAYENYWFPKLNFRTNTGMEFCDEP